MAGDMAAIAAAATISVAAIATAWAEKEIGTSAIGAMAEKESLFAKGLILTVIPETIIIFGLVVALQIVGMAGGGG
jgi:V/A-type H+-transporting ATPase subunit K